MTKVAVKVAAKKAACSKMAVRTAVEMVVRVAVEKLANLATKMDANLVANLACQMYMSDGYKFVKEKKKHACRRREQGIMHECAQQR